MVNRKQQADSIIYGKTFRRRAFYFLIFALACMTVYDVTNLTVEYAENPKQANMNMIFNQSMTFPNLTFCMSKRQAWSHFGINPQDKPKMEQLDQWRDETEKALANMTDHDTFMNESWPPNLVLSAYEAIATLNSLERESVAQQAMRDIKAFGTSPKMAKLRNLVDKWLEAIAERNVTFVEFTYKTGIETLKRSLRQFIRLSYNEDDEFRMKTRISWLSSKQMCFQPVFLDAQSFKAIQDQGEFFKLVLVHDPATLTANKTAGECMSLDFHGRPTTMARNMEGKGRVKDGTTEELCVGQIHEVTVDIRAHYTMLENDDKATACRNYDDVDDAEVNEFDCRSRCRMEMIRQMCRCTPLTLEYLSDVNDLERYPVCDYAKCEVPDNHDYTDQLCAQHCLPHCVQIRYNVQPAQKGRSLNPQITMITLLWGAFEYLDLEQKYVWTLWTFIAAIGGSIGLWLGLSVLSIIQLITFLTERTAEKVKEKTVSKQQQQSSHHHHSHPHYQQHRAPHKTASAAAIDARKPSSATDSIKERERKLSLNPFGGPVAVNPFESPFPKARDGPPPPAYTNNGTAVTTPPPPPKGVDETEFHSRAASP